jgi:hypothetical protein
VKTWALEDINLENLLEVDIYRHAKDHDYKAFTLYLGSSRFGAIYFTLVTSNIEAYKKSRGDSIWE